ncbi:MAG: hypothetical protein J6Y20_05475 [Lachnospiraceae bacterium]|nr:hypothetical protein [Lachnospiraceae bacterium]
MLSRGYIRRKTKEYTGKDIWYEVPQYKCQKCGKKHTVLPVFIFPRKQYVA